MFSSIVLVTDMLRTTRQILAPLSELRLLGVSKCVVLRRLQQFETDEAVSAFAFGLFEDELAMQKHLLEEAGFETQVRIIPRTGIQEIFRIAEDEGCGMAVTAESRHNVFSEILSGSLAQELIRHADRPVLVIRTGESPQDAGLLSHLLFTNDFSENAAVAFSFLKELAIAGAGQVTLLHVQDTKKIDMERLDEYNETDRARLEALAREIESVSDAKTSCVVSEGSPGDEIIKRAEGNDVSLVVMGSRGRGYLSGLILGSVSAGVVRRSPVSVLIVPKQAGNLSKD